MTNKIDLPHKTMFEACNPGTKLVSESQVAASAGIKVSTVRTYSGAAVPSRRYPPPSRSQGR